MAWASVMVTLSVVIVVVVVVAVACSVVVAGIFRYDLQNVVAGGPRTLRTMSALFMALQLTSRPSRISTRVWGCAIAEARRRRLLAKVLKETMIAMVSDYRNVDEA